MEVVYLHERHHELVRIPRLPLQWNEEIVLRNRKFFEWIDEEPRPTEKVEEWLKGNPELRFLTAPAEDGNTYLTVAGSLLCHAVLHPRRPRVVWPQADPRSPAEKNGLSGVAHERPAGWENFVRWLCSIDCVRYVRFDGEAGRGARVRLADAERGHIFVRYERSGEVLPLRVETTAQGEAQTALVAEYLKMFQVRRI
ncbi:MAG TPA: hypothetical protein VNO22_00365 [Planctomycetota bacterium]|nr:hypothetical protein [Planctomycetota bacterium]